jgi:peptidoglycan/LPS O-acetylase OafA/YrhL
MGDVVVEQSLPRAEAAQHMDRAVGLSARHVRALDGVRGIAVLMVLVFHSFVWKWREPTGLFTDVFNRIISMGWSGVDLFFVLSGFLITGILWDAKGSDTYFRSFYMRRILRIFPLYYGSLLVFTVILPAAGVSGVLVPGASPWWWWTYTQNILQAFPGIDGSYGALGYFWSLAIEEHFYLLWPLLMYWSSRRTALGLCVGCIVVAWLSRGFFLLHGNGSAAFCLTPCRIDALAIGALIALVARDELGRGPGWLLTMSRWLAAPVLAQLAVIVYVWPGQPFERVMQLAGYPLLAILYGILVIFAAFAPRGPRAMWGTRALEHPVLVFFGKYSYGMYVLHAAVYLLMDPWIAGWAFMQDWDGYLRNAVSLLVKLAVLVPAAMISWHLFEKQFLKLKRLFPY